ncbi:MAG: CBS domain-containing protein [Chitinophagales bacterium]|nr:CBS domain-containing protein [Chitinophagales bacterium]
MGAPKVKATSTAKQLQAFEKHLLNDLHALNKMLKEGMFEIDKTRIGAEQEFCLVDKHYKPAGKNIEMMNLLEGNPLFTTELARFNMEINASPQIFSKNCLSIMEKEILDNLDAAHQAADSLGIKVILTGILPTLRKFDFSMHNLTPYERYYALCESINKLRGKNYDLNISGIDELFSEHDSPLIEAANTGFQVHLQIKPDEFVDMYNISQAITAPVLASATNSPILFGKRLWKETRIALFSQSVDTRNHKEHAREMSPRVTFGDHWLEKSILEIYKEDIVKYRVLLNTEINENVFEKLETGTAPDLMALKVHNSTVYRWNRACYGISEGKAHLRIENRVLPAGPTVKDEMANAAFWLGLMVGVHDKYGDITQRMDFDVAKNNFLKASVHGLDTKLFWLDNKSYAASDLILHELLPLAKAGLKKQKVNNAEIEEYLGIIEARVQKVRTGSYWQLKSFNKLIKSATKEEVLAAITASTIQNQKHNIPVHNWKLAELDDNKDWKPSEVFVEEFMTTKVFTAKQEDIVELVSEMMDWQKIRYVAVENKKGKLVGLATSRMMLRAYMKHIHQKEKLPLSVGEVMIKDPMTIHPGAKFTEAMDIMTKYQFGCLPVVDDKNNLVGMVTEANFLVISKNLFDKIK